jgi:nitroreductase
VATETVLHIGGNQEPAEMSRRSALKMFGVGGATLLVAGTGLLSYRVYDTADLNPGGGNAYDPWHQWRDNPGPLGAVGAAILAANPHNIQPWIFHVTANTIGVYRNTARTIGTVDPLSREVYVGLGCALENLALACQARGLQPIITLLPDGASGTRVAHVDITPAPPRPGSLYDAIGDRHTNRGPYTGTTVTAQALAALVDTSGLPGVGLAWVTDPAQRASLGQLLIDAAVALTQDKQQSLDSFAWFRANNDAIERQPDGMTLDAQGMSPVMLSAAKLIPASSRSAGDTFWVDQTRSVQTKTAAAYGVLTGADAHDHTTQLRVGRLLQRIHLTATSRGIALQPMNQITERIDRELTTGALATFGPRFATFLPPGAEPVLAFRVGYPSREALPSPRLGISEVTR